MPQILPPPADTSGLPFANLPKPGGTPLKDARREKFCILVAHGMTQYKAYLEAGYSPGTTYNPNTRRGHLITYALKLSKRPKVTARIAELRSKTSDAINITSNDVLRMTIFLYYEGIRINQLSASAKAIELLGKFTGSWITRHVHEVRSGAADSALITRLARGDPQKMAFIRGLLVPDSFDLPPMIEAKVVEAAKEAAEEAEEAEVTTELSDTWSPDDIRVVNDEK